MAAIAPSPSPLPRAIAGGCRRPRQAARLLALAALVLALPAGAATITGTNDSDNNSFSIFPVWRSQLNGTSAGDTIHGLRGDDLIYGRAGNDILHGDQDSDRLYGESGDDQLLGGLDALDRLYGGTGNDIYSVFDTLDLVTEVAGEGTDTVRSTVNYTLPANVENGLLEPSLTQFGLIVAGSTTPTVVFHECATYAGPLPCREMGSTLTGNGLNNELRGNGGDNTLSGVAGNDRLLGGAGDDTLLGGDGDDILEGFVIGDGWSSSEWDMLTGGAGADVFVIGISSRSGAVSAYGSALASEQFPQYIGQGLVYITDFEWQEGDKIEVFGNISDYWIGLYGSTAVIYWDGSAYGYSSNEITGIVYGINSLADLIPAYDFL
jgi:Ca2+-binding RTX toxin-like protein